MNTDTYEEAAQRIVVEKLEALEARGETYIVCGGRGNVISLVVDEMKNIGGAPCATLLIHRAIPNLIAAGKIRHIKGDPAEEEAERRATAQRPVTQDEIAHFSALSPLELARAYFGNEDTKARYDHLVKLGYFRRESIPQRAAEPLPEDLGQWKTLDAKTYHSIPISVVRQRIGTDAQFRAAVTGLMRRGEI